MVGWWCERIVGRVAKIDISRRHESWECAKKYKYVRSRSRWWFQLCCIPTNLEKIMFHLPDIIFFKSLAAWDYLYASTCCTQFGPKTLDASLVIWLFNRNNSCGHLHVPYTKNRRFGTNWFRFFFRTAQLLTHQSKVMKVAPSAAFLKGTVGQMRSEYWWLPIYMNGTQLRTVRSEAAFMSGYWITWLQGTVGLEILQWIDGCKS